jgi:aspartyl-tRNA(Asn)/glutamyl-tRNA(Gln) amidotransferase subunit A
VGEPSKLGAAGLLKAFAAGEVSPREVVSAALARAESLDNVFTALSPAALEEAEEAEEDSEAKRSAGALAGVPVAIKDMFVDRGRQPTVGSRVHGPHLTGTAEAIKRIRRAGAIVIGYTNLHEWAIGTTSVTTATGPIRNPWDPALVAGGSSGGSAVAVATGVVPFALGTDAGGSIRVPAACCGIVGLKPTWGRVPFDGYVEGLDGPPVDHIGSLARSVGDARLLYEALADQLLRAVVTSDLRVGIATGFFADDVNPDVADAFGAAIELVGTLVASVREIEIEGVRFASQAVAASLLPHTARLLAADMIERPDDFEPATLNVLLLGQALTGQDELEAQNIRRRILDGWERAFTEVDVIITPTIPAPPCTIEHRTVDLRSGKSSADLAYTAFNSPMNLAGVPCLSLPVGEFPNGLPFNISLTARQGRENVVLAFGEAIENALDNRYTNRLAGT